MRSVQKFTRKAKSAKDAFGRMNDLSIDLNKLDTGNTDVEVSHCVPFTRAGFRIFVELGLIEGVEVKEKDLMDVLAK